MTERIQHAGLTIELHHDHDCESPLEGDLMPRFAFWHRNYINPAPEYSSPEDVEQAVKDGAIAFPVRAYEHGCIAFTISGAGSYPFTDAWDSAWAGYLVYPKELLQDVPSRGKELQTEAESIMEEYTKWANGECYWYDITNAVGDTLDTCGGFIGYNYAVEAAKEAAEHCAKVEAERVRTYTAIKMSEDGDKESHSVEAVSMKDALRQLDFEPLRLELTA